MNVEVALAQPVTAFGEGAAATNRRSARELIHQAADTGADIVVFPESFPGEWRRPIRSVPVEALQEMAAAERIHVVGGFAEPLDGDGVRCYNSIVLVGPDGEEIGRYRRTTPNHAPWIYDGSDYWDFEWVNADELPVFDTSFGTVGLLMCSEIYAPELARILAVKGAEIIFLPAGMSGPEYHGGGVGGSLYETWRILAQARAIENLAYTGVCANLPRPDSLGLCMLSGPEGLVMEAQGAGVHRASVDLDRLRLLRAESDRLVDGPAPWRAKPGVLRDWRRQAVFDANPELTQGTP